MSGSNQATSTYPGRWVWFLRSVRDTVGRARTAAGIALLPIGFLADVLNGFPAFVLPTAVLALVLVYVDWRAATARVATGACVGLCLLDALWLPLPLSAAAAFASSGSAVLVAVAALCRRRAALQDRLRRQGREIADLSELVDFVPQVLWRVDKSGRVTYFNKRYEEVTGGNADAVIRDQTWLASFHPDDARRYEDFRSTCSCEMAAGRIRTRHRQADGSYRWMLIDRRPIRCAETGAVLGWVGGASDIDELLRAQEAVRALTGELERRLEEHSQELVRTQNRFQTLFYETNVAFAEEYVGDAKAMIDDVKRSGVTDFWSFAQANPEFIKRCLASMRVTKISDALVQLLGYDSPEQIVAQAPEAQLEDNRLMLLQLAALFDERASFSSSTVVIGQGGRRIPVAIQINVVSDWTVTFATLIDITEQQRAQEMLRIAQQELARANRVAAVGAFSAALAHELNQPIAAISMDAQTSRRWLEREPPDVEEALQSLGRVAANAGRVVAITQKTREQVSKGRRPHGSFDLCILIDETLSLLDQDADMRQIRSSVDCDRVYVLGDRVEIQQVLTNLVVNAVEAMAAMPAGSRSGIIAARGIDGGRIGVTVADNGPGIEAPGRNDIFEPFYTTKPNGVGLGLQICRSIVEAHGGRLTARSGESGGAIFEFDLPLACP